MAINDKKSFVLYNNYETQFKLLSMEERGQLITAIFEYSNCRKVTSELSPVVNMAFSFIKEVLDRDMESYLEKCEKNTENGKKGGRPRKNISASKTERFFEKPKKADNDNGIDNDNDIVIGNGIGEDMVMREYSEPVFAPEPSSVSDSPAKAPRLTEEEKRELIKKGLPESYIRERLDRASAYADLKGECAFKVLERWWQEDKSNRQAEPQRRAQRGVLDSGEAKSYDSDEFFAAALDRSNSILYARG